MGGGGEGKGGKEKIVNVTVTVHSRNGLYRPLYIFSVHYTRQLAIVTDNERR